MECGREIIGCRSPAGVFPGLGKAPRCLKGTEGWRGVVRRVFRCLNFSPCAPSLVFPPQLAAGQQAVEIDPRDSQRVEARALLRQLLRAALALPSPRVARKATGNIRAAFRLRAANSGCLELHQRQYEEGLAALRVLRRLAALGQVRLRLLPLPDILILFLLLLQLLPFAYSQHAKSAQRIGLCSSLKFPGLFSN